VRIIAETGKDPTREDLSNLFLRMELDSPLGEMKEEAFAIWREMRSRGIVPTADGIVSLLKVTFSLGWGLMVVGF
jgi:hypothetical protein